MIYGLHLTLLPTAAATNIPPLATWLATTDLPVALIPIVADRGVVKVSLVLAHCESYPALLQAVMTKLLDEAIVEWQGQTYTVVGIESDRAPLQTISLLLETTVPLPPNLWEACHALVFDWLKLTDPALATQLHSAAVSPLRLNYRLDRDRQRLFLYISLLQGELLAPLLWGIHQQFGQAFAIAKIACQLQPNFRRIQQATWDSLAATTPQKKVHLVLHSPTSFKRAGIIESFPLVDLVFNSLWRRWNAFAPTNLQFSEVHWSAMVAAYDLKTVAVFFNNLIEIGAKGWVRYEFPDPEQAAIATVLAQFANFAGVGRKTPYGMGHVAFNGEQSTGNRPPQKTKS